MTKDTTSLPVSALTVLSRRFDPYVDAFATVGRLRDARGLGQYAAFWIPRHSPDKVVGLRRFSDRASAERVASKMLKTHDIGDSALLSRDRQKQKLYDWEHKALMPQSRKISKSDAQSLIGKVCADHGIDPPRLRWQAHTEHSEYDYGEHAIYFGARDNISLLHELAHVILNDETEDAPLPQHAPAFVYRAIELYVRYGGIDEKAAFASAHKAGLLGPDESHQPVPVSKKPRLPKYTAR